VPEALPWAIRDFGEIKQASSHLIFLSQDLKGVLHCSRHIETYLQEQDFSSNVLHPAAFADPNEVLEDCVTVLNALRRIVHKFIEHEQTSKLEPRDSATSGSQSFNHQKISNLMWRPNSASLTCMHGARSGSTSRKRSWLCYGLTFPTTRLYPTFHVRRKVVSSQVLPFQCETCNIWQ
jgi:hypothetical protein